MLGMPSGRFFPFGFGMWTRRTGRARSHPGRAGGKAGDGAGRGPGRTGHAGRLRSTGRLPGPGQEVRQRLARRAPAFDTRLSGNLLLAKLTARSLIVSAPAERDLVAFSLAAVHMRRSDGIALMLVAERIPLRAVRHLSVVGFASNDQHV